VQVAITCRHGTVRDEVRSQISQKAEKLLTYFERVTAIQITLDFMKDFVKAEILVDAEHKHNFVAHAEAPDVVASFDGALHKMEQQIRRYKEKVQDHRRDLPMNAVVEERPVTDLLSDGAPGNEAASPNPAEAESGPHD
jgi:putative sigma-54 modulation protein